MAWEKHHDIRVPDSFKQLEPVQLAEDGAARLEDTIRP